mmetsp:Transcript_27539/g.39445  ORF Transcript_27539/g.39445 Transcript_27539/m.39445 type:complete len:293 (+) Transcript_27539:73-951(+)
MRTLSLLAALPFALAFSPTAIHRPSSHSIIRNNLVDVSVISNIHGRRTASMIRMATDDDAASSPPKKRKRKDGQKFSPPPTADVTDNSEEEEASASDEVAAAAVPEEPKKTSVVMKVRDIRDIVSGAPEPIEEDKEYVDDDDDDDEELADDEEWEYYDVDEDGNEIVVNDDKTSDRTGDDSLEQLLADARSMRASSTDSDGKSVAAEEETPIKDKIFDVISTIVTIDFFLVLGLLAWFLLGIFCSYVLKDDTVQIAFNMNFEKLTQPALGVLMIGSVAGSLGNKDEEEDSYL